MRALKRTSIVATLAILVALAAISAPAPAAAQGAAPAPAALDQAEATIGRLQAHNRIVVYSEDRGAGKQLYAQRVRENGFSVGRPWEATAPTGSGADKGMKGEQRFPALSGDILFWSEKAPGAADFDIFAQRLFSNGRPNGSPYLISTGPGDQLHPAAVTTSNGMLVVYSEDTSDEGDVMGIRVTGALSPRGAAFPIVAGPGVAADPTIGVDFTQPRNLLVLFEYKTDTMPTKDLYGVRVVESGLPRGGSTGGLFPVISTDKDEYAPSLLVSDLDSREGRSLLVYTQDDPADGPDIVSQRIRNNGYTVGGTTTLAGGPGVQTLAAAMLNNADEWVVTWQDDSPGSFDIFLQRVRLNGYPRPHVYTVAAD